MNCTNKKSISGLVLEKKILDELNSIVEQYCQADKIQLRDIYSEQLKQLEADLARLNERHSSAEKRLLAMYKDKLDRNIADEFIDYVEIGESGENGEREIHIHWKL